MGGRFSIRVNRRGVDDEECEIFKIMRLTSNTVDNMCGIRMQTEKEYSRWD